MNRITFQVLGEPRGQPRPRAFVRGGRARVYDPGSAEGWKGLVALAALEHRPPQPIDRPVALSLRFQMPRPRSHHRRHGLKAGAPSCHTSKPDLDNLAKAVLDALVALGFLRDDRLVWSLRTCKRYADGPAGCEVHIRY